MQHFAKRSLRCLDCGEEAPHAKSFAKTELYRGVAVKHGQRCFACGGGRIRHFASKAEWGYYWENLRLLERAGEIRELEFQPRLKLCPKVEVVADFSFFDAKQNRRRWVDVKARGVRLTNLFVRNQRLVKHFLEIKIEVARW
jgi:hypothetical protein